MSKFNKPIFVICLLISTLLNAQNPNSDFFRIATPNSTYDWLEIRPELQLRLEEFLAQKTALGLSSDDDFLLLKTETDELGKTHSRYQQTYKNIPVSNAQFLVHLSERGFVETANGHLIRNLQKSAIPAFSELGALSTALNYIRAEEYAWQNDAYQKLLKQVKKDPNATFYPKGELEWTSKDFTDNHPQNYRLTYELQVYAIQPLQHVKLYIDAQNRTIINELSQLYDADSLGTGETNYSCKDTVEFHTQYDGEDYLLLNDLGGGINTVKLSLNSNNFKDILDNDNHWTGDKTAVDIHWAMEQTYLYFLDKHGLVNLGGDPNDAIVGVAHFNNSCNAFWDGNVTNFGDGGPFCNPVTSPDVVAHEQTHRVIQYSAGLIYKKEPGALNESFSDIFGVLVHFEADPECANWVIGEEVQSGGFRDMSNPQAFNHPDTYLGNCWNPTNSNCLPNTSCTSYSNCGKDKYGVHINSGVQNYWFYLLAEGGSDTNDNGYAYDITGIGKEKAAKIAYRNLTVYLSPTSNYADARNGSVLAVIDLYGASSIEAQAVIDAWCAVGVGNTNCTILEATLTLDSPNGGENWSAGDTEIITWTNEGVIENIRIEYSLNEGNTWEEIISSTPNDGSFEWQIPTSLSTNLAQIRIASTNDFTLKDESDAVFSIEACDVSASFTTEASDYTICEGNSLTFENQSLNAETYEWQIDATTLATSTDFSYKFDTAGTFIVNLISTNINGCKDHFYETIEVNGTPDTSFNYQANGLTVYFAANELNANSYTWNFGDGTTAEDTSLVSHTYSEVGTYTVCFALEDDCGSDEGCQEIEVKPYNCLFADSLELVKLYEATGGDQWTNNIGWLEENVSEWFGVTLSEDGCSVEKIGLRNNDLVSVLPDLNLPNLSSLDLYNNQLSGNIPNFSNLNSLKSLTLATNQLSGN
ncbi:MAG: M4 family metallopeptidase, partial [Chitinophagales bacterium]